LERRARKSGSGKPRQRAPSRRAASTRAHGGS
jgi:hypothetical protein